MKIFWSERAVCCDSLMIKHTYLEYTSSDSISEFRTEINTKYCFSSGTLQSCECVLGRVNKGVAQMERELDNLCLQSEIVHVKKKMLPSFLLFKECNRKCPRWCMNVDAKGNFCFIRRLT